jgi:NAD(P)-dependent dehydrogenase (short-subunit alcohol dehydrogenase family)
MALHCDATKWADVQRVVDRAQELGPIDVCYHGVAWDHLGTFLEIDPADWDRIIDVNLRSVLIAYRIILPIMKEQRRGCFITVSSVMGRKPTPIEPLYGACKAGLIYLNHTLALELGEYGVRLNVVAPGPTPPPDERFISRGSCFGMFDPEMLMKVGEQFRSSIPLRKLANPFDSAQAVLFLASEITGGHQTGQVIGVDGGWYMPH